MEFLPSFLQGLFWYFRGETHATAIACVIYKDSQQHMLQALHSFRVLNIHLGFPGMSSVSRHTCTGKCAAIPRHWKRSSDMTRLLRQAHAQRRWGGGAESNCLYPLMTSTRGFCFHCCLACLLLSVQKQTHSKSFVEQRAQGRDNVAWHKCITKIFFLLISS